MFSYKANAICMAGMTMPAGAGVTASHCLNRVRKPGQLINYARFWPHRWTFAKNRTAHAHTHYRKSTQWQWASFVSAEMIKSCYFFFFLLVSQVWYRQNFACQFAKMSDLQNLVTNMTCTLALTAMNAFMLSSTFHFFEIQGFIISVHVTIYVNKHYTNETGPLPPYTFSVMGLSMCSSIFSESSPVRSKSDIINELSGLPNSVPTVRCSYTSSSWHGHTGHAYCIWFVGKH